MWLQQLKQALLFRTQQGPQESSALCLEPCPLVFGRIAASRYQARRFILEHSEETVRLVELRLVQVQRPIDKDRHLIDRIVCLLRLLAEVQSRLRQRRHFPHHGHPAVLHHLLLLGRKVLQLLALEGLLKHQTFPQKSAHRGRDMSGCRIWFGCAGGLTTGGHLLVELGQACGRVPLGNQSLPLRLQPCQCGTQRLGFPPGCLVRRFAHAGRVSAASLLHFQSRC